jgi:hypothetical protein
MALTRRVCLTPQKTAILSRELTAEPVRGTQPCPRTDSGVSRLVGRPIQRPAVARDPSDFSFSTHYEAPQILGRFPSSPCNWFSPGRQRQHGAALPEIRTLSGRTPGYRRGSILTPFPLL